MDKLLYDDGYFELRKERAFAAEGLKRVEFGTGLNVAWHGRGLAR